MASVPSCMKEAGIHPFTKACYGPLHVGWPLRGSAPGVGKAFASLVFPCSHPHIERIAASDGGEGGD